MRAFCPDFRNCRIAAIPTFGSASANADRSAANAAALFGFDGSFKNRERRRNRTHKFLDRGSLHGEFARTRQVSLGKPRWSRFVRRLCDRQTPGESQQAEDQNQSANEQDERKPGQRGGCWWTFHGITSRCDQPSEPKRPQLTPSEGAIRALQPARTSEPENSCHNNRSDSRSPPRADWSRRRPGTGCWRSW